MRVEVEGIELDCRVVGDPDAAWVTFVPGITNDLTFWDSQVAALGDRFRTLTYSPRGHGASDAPADGYSVARLGADVVALWDTLGIARSHLVGLGFGGSMSIGLALDRPDRVDRLVAAACRASMTPDFIELWRTRAALARADGMGPLVDETVRRWFSPGFALDHPREMERVRAMVRATSVVGYVGHALAFTTIDLGARLPELHAPTLFVSGGGDPGGGRSDIMQSMADAAPNARHVAIEGAGHICNIEASDAFNALVGAFLATDQPLHSPGGRGEASPDG